MSFSSAAGLWGSLDVTRSQNVKRACWPEIPGHEPAARGYGD
jgi:hypothetical protein